MSFTERNFFKTAVLALSVMLIAWAVFMPTTGETKDPTLAKMGLSDFASSEITYDGVMHEIYWHYELANQMARSKKNTDAKAHLKALKFYVNILPYMQRDRKYFKSKESIQKFDQYAISLLAAIDKLYGSVGKGSASTHGKAMAKSVSAMCHHCHDKRKEKIDEITPYGKSIAVGGSVTGFIKNEVGYDGVMHELYWHYEFANQMIRANRKTDAKAHLKIMSFYVGMLPKMPRTKEFFKTADDSKKFDSYARQLKSAVDNAYKKMGSGDAKAVGKQMHDSVSKMCHHCHDKLRESPVREVTPYGNKITLGK